MSDTVYAPRPVNELERLEVLREYALLDTPPEPALDEFMRLAAHIFGASTAVINLLDDERTWAKAAMGRRKPSTALPRGETLCAWTILDTTGPMVVADASLDGRFADAPIVRLGLRFYAGSPLVSPEGLPFGTLCVMDETPRFPSAEQLESLGVLATAVVAHLNLHRQTLMAERIAGRLKELEEQRESELRGLRMLARVQGQFARGDELLTVWNEVCEAAVEICKADGAQIWKVEENGSLRAHASAGVDLTGFVIPVDAQTAVRSVLAGEGPCFVEDARENPHAVSTLLRQYGVVSLSLRPVESSEGVSAALCLFWTDRRPPLTPQEEHLLDLLGGESAVAIERMTMLGQLRELSQTDALTGAPNRRTLTVELRRAIEAAKRRQTPLCVGMFDLDHFKAYNDKLGHLAGDELLKEGVAAWQNQLRVGDLLARYGGEEFALVLPDCEPEEAVTLVERLRSATPRGQRFSAGIARFAEPESGSRLLERADQALYEAKRAGRNRTEVAPPPSDAP